MPVLETADFRAARDETFAWLWDNRPADVAFAWYDASRRAVAELASMPQSYPQCLDPAVQGLGLREKYFGAG